MRNWLIFAVVAGALEITRVQANADTTRPLHEIDRQIVSLCQRETKAGTPQERAAVAYEMTELHREIVADPRFATSNSLKAYRARLWSRLTRIKKDIQAKLRRENKANRYGEPSEAERVAAAETTRSLGDQFMLAGLAWGGPAGLFSQAGASGGGAVPPDYGTDLVDLIQRTIQPEFWDVHGGPGTIVYYRPLHCLVVRASSDVHHRLGGTLSAVRAAGN